MKLCKFEIPVSIQVNFIYSSWTYFLPFEQRRIYTTRSILPMKDGFISRALIFAYFTSKQKNYIQTTVRTVYINKYNAEYFNVQSKIEVFKMFSGGAPMELKI